MNDHIVIKINDWSKISADTIIGLDDTEMKGDIIDKLYTARLNNIGNMKLHFYKDDLWTSGYIGVSRLRNRCGSYLKTSDGKDIVLHVLPRFRLHPFAMLNEILADEECESYMRNEKPTEPMFQVFEHEPLIETDSDIGGEILLAITFVKLCESVCRKQLKAQMTFREQNFTAKSKGKIEFSKHIQKNICTGREDRIYCRYSDFSLDTIENQILKVALLKADTIIKNSKFKISNLNSSIKYCKTMLNGVSTVTLNSSLFGTAKTTGLYAYYQKPIALAKLIYEKSGLCAGYKKDSQMTHKIIPYAINMERLFELYVRTVIRKQLNTGYYLGKYNESYPLLEDSLPNTHLIRNCIPDIVIKELANTNAEKTISVYDVKYKDANISNREDSHQLLAYAFLLGADKCGFILPTQIEENECSSDIAQKSRPESSVKYYEYYVDIDSSN